jgi:hypothetical protein
MGHDDVHRLLNIYTATQRESIEKLAGLHNVALLCTAHTGCTTDYARAMKYWRKKATHSRFW